MNDDYLWDKSGPPDPDIQRLENILGTLRYQPKPFEISGDVRAPRRRNYFPLLAAIAATLLVALLAGSIWLRSRSRNEAPQQAKVPNAPAVTPSVEEKIGPAPEPEKTLAPRERNVVVHYRRRNRSSGLTRREREEALAAKQQLMIALRLASEKLNLAHKKTQSTPPANQIKNQHRVG
ncbi:MAG TPA: hypothetical protein VJ656_08010 [Pyrinomonadaceae bacterium]|nr:hypothetical protein [Pyrinomonadaceae bacterium]